ncbi:MAG: penicillin acylase family protein, partial [Kiloniellales bacterium]
FLVWALRAIAGLGLLLALVSGGAYLWLRGSLPETEGTVVIAGLEASVEVLRDADGVVTIRAGGERDAALALGYVHAQDRLWQMDVMRRLGAGRLSEILGPATLPSDRRMRTLGLYRVAEANLAQLSAPARALVEAYADGVNAFIADPGGPLPLEFQILWYAPEPWRPTDSLVWGRLIALRLAGNRHGELLRARLSRRLSPEQFDFLWPGYPADAPITIGDLAPLLDDMPLERLGTNLPWERASNDASNSWVLAGSQTESGRPILANDPHLGLSAPGQWYLARIETPELTVTGATAPGLPFVVFGHNGHIAWGFTNTQGDAQDHFIEKVVDGDPARYQTPDGPRRFETREVVIAVKGAASERITVRKTRHGPVVSDVLPRTEDAAAPETVLALAWPALRADDRSTEALYGINRARDWTGFLAALENFHSPQQNIVYADTSGTIGFIAPARVPIRKRGDGRAPVPGWSGEFDWTGFVPFDELPMSVNPPSGRIVAANNKIVPDDYPHLITADWADHYRARRINEILAAPSDPGRSAADARAMQQDITSLGVRELLPLLLEAKPESDRGRNALELLRAWDQRLDREQAAPLVFYAWILELNRVLLADELGEAFGDFQYPRIDLLARILSDGRDWCDDIGTAAREACAGQLVAALEAALDHLWRRFERPAERLRWGQAHVARFAHPVLSRLPLFDVLFGYGVETDGGNYTLNKAGVRVHGPPERLFEDIHGPGYRAVYDLADLDDSRFMIATGQSGNPLSPLYGNLAERWRDGIYLKLDGAETDSTARLRLIPAGSNDS